MSLLDDLQNIAAHLSPSDIQTGDRVVGALIKVLEHNGLTVPAVEELLPEDHPARVSPPPPPAGQPQQDVGGLVARLEAALAKLEGKDPSPSSGQGQADVGSESSAPSSEPAPPSPEPPGPELDRP